jgi:hypothetical protein
MHTPVSQLNYTTLSCVGCPHHGGKAAHYTLLQGIAEDIQP